MKGGDVIVKANVMKSLLMILCISLVLFGSFCGTADPALAQGTTIQAFKSPLAIIYGGTGATTAAGIRTGLGLATGDSPVFVTVKLSGLTDGYIPKHTSDAVGLENSPIFISGSNVGIGTTAPGNILHIVGTLNPAMTVQQTGGKFVSLLAGAVGTGFIFQDTGGFYIYPGATITTNSYTGNKFMMMDGASGHVGIGTTPTARLHLPASTATANTASLKIDPGVVATTAVSGNIESDGTHLYWTDSGGTRKQLD
jgi:hypothetical protein